MKAVRKANGIQTRFRNTASSKKLATVSCAILAIAALAIPVAASASTTAPSSGSLYFARSTAKLVGGTAVIPVQCVGVKGSLCSGTLSVQVGGATTEAPFSVSSGGNRTVSIPVSGAVSGAAAVATAKTTQTYGGFATATEVLRLR